MTLNTVEPSAAGSAGAAHPAAEPMSRPVPLARPLRVLLVQTQAEGAGAQEITRLLAAGLDRRGMEVHTLFFYRRTGAYDGQPRTTFVEPARPNGPLGMLRFFRRLMAAIRRIDPDVVITYQHFGNAVGAAAARLVCRAPVIANQVSTQAVTPKPIRLLDRLLGQIGAYDVITVNSAATLADYSHHPASYRRRIVSIPHGFENKTIALPKDAARAALGLPAGVTLLGSTGRLHATKNFDAAIRLLPERPGWHLAIAGQGAERDALGALCASLGVAERVHFLGELSPADVGVFLAGLDVFVFPSLGETFGLAVVEAAQTGVPVVANDLSVLREVLASDGEPAAVFVDVDDTAAFRTAVDGVLADPVLAGRVSAAGRRLERRYSVDAMVDAYVETMRTVLPAGSRP